MRRLRLIWLGLWFVAMLGFTMPVQAQADAIRVKITQVDGSDFPAVRVFVSITDAQGQPVVGLQRSQLTITEDGKPVDLIDFVGSGGGSANTLLIIDHSGSMKDGKLEGAQEAAASFVDLMRPADQVGLLVFDDAADLVQPLTSDQAALHRSIDRVRLGGGTALYDAVQEGVGVLRTVEGRRSVIVLSDGSDRDSQSSLGSTISMVKRADLTINTIGLGDRNDLSEDALTELAESTGGTYFYAPTADQLATLYGSLSQELKTEYSFIYRSPRAAYDGTQRNIGIQFSQGGDTFGASSSYLEKHLLQLRSNALVGTLLLETV